MGYMELENIRGRSTSAAMRPFPLTIIHSLGMSSDASQSTGITVNLNNIILNNVSAGYWHWIVMITVLSATQNGMMPSLASYSLLPYGDLAYIYCVTIEKILNPLTALLPLLLPQYLLSSRFIFISAFGW
eukprot:391264_1